jgi:hypothetical protein
MIVWLAEHHVIYECTTIIGIFSTKELAQEAVDRHKTTLSFTDDSEWWVTKWHVDGHPMERAQRG